MASPSPTYEPRRPGSGDLYQVVRDHFETFRAQVADLRDGEGLPGFVEQEFQNFLRCGSFGAGFARFRCSACGFDRLVPFACKGRGFCPSCGGRRMTERAAHLVDRVFPRVPVRQWVLSLPPRLRYRLAWDQGLCRTVVECTMRAILGFLRHRARDTGVRDARGGGVAIVQRFGGALNLNIHLPALVLDGVFSKHGSDLHVHPCSSLDTADVDDVLATVEAYVHRLTAPPGSSEEDDGLDMWGDEAPTLAGLRAAAVEGRVALGPRAGARVRRCGTVAAPPAEPPELGQCRARHNGFDLHAGLRVPADARDRLERMARYALRPPVSQDRLELTDDGQVRLELRRPWADGTTHLLFEPVELLERLAALTPRPRINLILYHGVLAPRAAWRPRVVQFGTAEPLGAADAAAAEGEYEAPDGHQRRNYLWAELMRRSLGLDVLSCPRCGGRLQLIALIDDAPVIRRILGHLGLPMNMPEARPARAPPVPLLRHESATLVAPDADPS